MPSRIRAIDTAVISTGTDTTLVQKGRRVEQIAVVTLPGTAVGLVGIRIGTDGDLMRLNMQGQAFNLSEDDQTAGVFLLPMGAPTGVVEFAIAFLGAPPAPTAPAGA